MRKSPSRKAACELGMDGWRGQRGHSFEVECPGALPFCDPTQQPDVGSDE